MLRSISRSLVPLAVLPLALHAQSAPVARFDWFQYEGRDSVYDARTPGPNEYLNPILTGFYPDPSVTRVGSDYYLVTSTFAYFPGIPVWHSRDLVSWTQIGNVITRPSQLSFDSLGMSRGVFAPTIQYKAGTFYVLNTCVDCGGNYLVTATDPAGPWSDPVWLRGIGGIDPSLFFDDDGRTYILNNDAPVGPPLYEGHRAIWIQAFDLAKKTPFGPRSVVVNGGVDLSTKPIWIEGPHVFKVNGRYYLSAAEGGTAEGHSQVILRSDKPTGPYVPYPGNPILTQRGLDRGRPFPITSAGHAELVQTQNGDWWATFLATRPYAGDFYNTGRETYLLPVTWSDGWPHLTTDPIPYTHARPNLPATPVTPAKAGAAIPTRGNFTVRDEFDGPALAPSWLLIRTPRDTTWYDLRSAAGSLSLRARPIGLSAFGQPSYVGRRQQHQRATATTVVRFTPEREGDKAGIAAFQNDDYYYSLAVGMYGGQRAVVLEKRTGKSTAAAGNTIATASLPAGNDPIYLRIEADGGRYRFAFGTKPDQWIALGGDVDGTVLSTRTAGGFVGVTLGLFAYAGPR